MTWPHATLWLATSVGLFAAVRNPTAGALSIGWLAIEIYWMATGENLSAAVGFCADITVLAVIFAKATWKEGSRTYPTMRAQIVCFWRALTLWDKLIAGGYVFAWPLYGSNAYWLPWGIFVAQLLFADAEVISNLLGQEKRRVMPNRPPGGLAYVAGDGGYV